MTKIARKLNDPEAKANNESRRHPLAEAELHEVQAWVNANINSIADVRKVLVWLIIVVLRSKRGKKRKKGG